MTKSQYTIKSQLAFEILRTVFFLLISALDVFFESKYMILAFLADGIVLVIIFMFDQKFKGINDELSNQILSKVNKISLKFMHSSILFISFIATTTEISEVFRSIGNLGIVLISALLIFDIFRFFLFIYYDRKGIYE